jgi:hypothetical protein
MRIYTIELKIVHLPQIDAAQNGQYFKKTRIEAQLHGSGLLEFFVRDLARPVEIVLDSAMGIGAKRAKLSSGFIANAHEHKESAATLKITKFKRNTQIYCS